MKKVGVFKSLSSLLKVKSFLNFFAIYVHFAKSIKDSGKKKVFLIVYFGLAIPTIGYYYAFAKIFSLTVFIFVWFFLFPLFYYWLGQGNVPKKVKTKK
ncbi:MAG: hypothetical protein L3J07_00865 [Candidatus Magasanikbacteria bacterium]|nr:hypothetical protein [Candidatus Magasanikbacteria bacterium]